ncbi:MAG TPA: imidazole glycerol phosphate synthase subunit HisH [Verrucomicrobiae bacterium]|jgi:imidazole glycerol phosphate synthase glutamine amidotransferase subunit|nr:imidazole glycerol phosphate synthase subunit HisH [Verrucomicrobiae bacterium]
MNISLLDYGAGNLPSVERALQRLGVQIERVSTSAGVAKAAALILPGVGHYGALLRALDRDGLRESLIATIERGVPFLGICLGLQALFENSEEAPDLHGLEILSGSVRVLNGAVKLPHMGWDQLQAKAGSRLLEGIDSEAYFYFAHSYAVPYRAEKPGLKTRATCSYGGEFVAVTETENIFAVQFHPEKSGDAGQRVLENFLRIAA